MASRLVLSSENIFLNFTPYEQDDAVFILTTSVEFGFGKQPVPFLMLYRFFTF